MSAINLFENNEKTAVIGVVVLEPPDTNARGGRSVGQVEVKGHARERGQRQVLVVEALHLAEHLLRQASASLPLLRPKRDRSPPLWLWGTNPLQVLGVQASRGILQVIATDQSKEEGQESSVGCRSQMQ